MIVEEVYGTVGVVISYTLYWVKLNVCACIYSILSHMSCITNPLLFYNAANVIKVQIPSFPVSLHGGVKLGKKKNHILFPFKDKRVNVNFIFVVLH